jgi:putative peptidoglycan lipid II flippase
MLGTTIFVSLASLFVSFTGFVNQLVLALLFGASMRMDAYLIAISAPMLVSGVLSAVLGYSLVPALIQHKTNFVTYRSFSGLLLFSLATASVGISIAGFFAAPTQIAILGEGLSVSAKLEAVEIAQVSWITTGLIFIVDYLRGMHNAERRFFVPIFASLVPQIGMIVAGLLFGATYGPLAVAWGMFIGFSLLIPIMLIQTFPMFDFSTRSLVLWKDVVRYLYRVPLVMIAMLCFTVFQSVDAYWAPHTGVGSLAYLSYSQRILVALGSLIIVGPAAVILPRLAQAYSDGRVKDMLYETCRAVRMTLIFSMPVALSVGILAEPLVRALFERGEFNQSATQGVAAILPLMMVGMMAMLCVVMIFRALFAKHDTVSASLLGIIAAILYFGFSGLLSRYFGIEGIAFAYALTWGLVLTLSALLLWQDYLEILFCRENLIFLGQFVMLAVLMAVVLTAGRHSIVEVYADAGVLILQLGIVITLSIFIYFTVAIHILRIKDVRLIYTFLSSKCTSLIPRRE